MTIEEFILARLDEDEADARAAAIEGIGAGAEWMVTDVPYEGIAIWSPQPEDHLPGSKTGRTEHIARHDPARVVREVDGKHAILAECASILEPMPGGWEYEDAPNLAWLTLCGLAAAWSDHPDYNQEWELVDIEEEP